jgi:hypothetical protein
MTAGTIIANALRELKVLRWPGQTPATEESADGLTALNNMIDSWSTERLMLPYASFSRYPLIAAQAVYTIGPSGANLTGPRPIRIDAAGIVQLAYNSGAGDFRTPLEIIPETAWVAIADKTATSDIPLKLYYAPTPGTATLYLWPIPNVSSATSLELSVWAALAAFPDQTTDVPLATGYARALVFNLALELGSTMPGADLTQAVVSNAQESKQAIMKLNSLMVPDMPDEAIPPATNVEFRPVPSQLGAAVRMSQPGTAAAIQAAQQVK